MADLEDLTRRMREFTEARDWGRFHDLKSLTLALAGEVGEVAELVQWLPVGAVPDEALQNRLGDELADVLLYLMRLADVAGVDLGAAALAKLVRNDERFPVDEYRSLAPEHDRCPSRVGAAQRRWSGTWSDALRRADGIAGTVVEGWTCGCWLR